MIILGRRPIDAEKMDKNEKLELQDFKRELVNQEINNRLIPYLIKIGSLIRAKRKEIGMTQEDVANVVGCEAGYIGKIENGYANVTAKILFKICVTVGVGLSDLAALDKIDAGRNYAHVNRIAEITRGYDDSQMEAIEWFARNIAGVKKIRFTKE